MRSKVYPSEAWNRIFEKPFPRVSSTSRIHFDNAAGELAVFRGERVRQHSHRVYSDDGYPQCGLSGEGIEHCGRIHQGVGLIGASSFDPYESIESTHDTWKKR